MLYFFIIIYVPFSVFCVLFVCKCVLFKFLTAFTKLRKPPIGYLSARPHGTIWPLLIGFSCNFIFKDFWESVGKILERITSTLHEELCTFMISPWMLLVIRNVSDKVCRGNQNTHCMFNNFSEDRVVYETMWKTLDTDRTRTTVQHIACVFHAA
jgi:hypothetical protein